MWTEYAYESNKDKSIYYFCINVVYVSSSRNENTIITSKLGIITRICNSDKNQVFNEDY